MGETNNRCVGVIDSVSPQEIKAILLDNAPKNVSILEGNISFFPRINSYLVIPNETGCLVGIISWIGYNHYNTNCEVNLPKGSRMIYLNTLGHIKENIKGLEFERGAFSLPTVGDPILLPTMEQLNSIIANHEVDTITLGTSPLAGNQEIKISVDKLFGRHLAVLGNTGSGKSCTVSGIIRWSIEDCLKVKGTSPNARFIILDPNGEYRNAFSDLDIDVKYCAIKVNKHEEVETKQLRVPAWMWTSQEWAGIMMASGKTQKPILREALRDLKASQILNSTERMKGQSELDLLKVHLHNMQCFLKESIVNQSYLNTDKTKFGKELESRRNSMNSIVKEITETYEFGSETSVFSDNIAKTLDDKHVVNDRYDYYNAFDLEDIKNLSKILNELIGKLGKPEEKYLCDEDDPLEFNIANLAPYIEALAQDSAASQYVEFMTIRIKSLLRNTMISSVIGNKPEITLLDWINEYMTNTGGDRGKICIIDLSIVPLDVVHLIVAVVSRLIFESLQRYRKHYGKELPTVLVMEEAHTFIKRYVESNDDFSSDKLCTQIFERIAREGRKFGLGLVASSQRPSELSATVLSQCNSYILHRIVNDKDQEMIKRLVPDNLGRMLDELPSLPTKKAIVLGSAVPIPTLVEIRDLPFDKRPKSDNPEFWKVWTGEATRSLDWKPITDEWQKAKVYNKSIDDINLE